MALDATVGGANANAYLDRTTADAYFANRLYASDWNNATTGTKEQALMTATARIDQETFIGYRVSTTQALRWPRFSVPIPGEEFYYGGVGGYYATDSIPKPVKDATCEMALYLLANDFLKPTGLENFKALTVGPIAMEMLQPIRSGILPDQVSRLLAGLLTGAGQGEIVRS